MALAAARRDPHRSQARGVAFFGTWMITGLFLDGWSHNHQKPETFFTPWHAVLYSGFVAAVVWGAWDSRREERVEDMPVAFGGPLMTVGFVMFAAGAVGDFAWHQVFGIERNLAALLSPTHLLLMTGGLLMVTAPVRAAWSTPSGRRLSWRDGWPVIGSLTLAVGVVSFFLMYVSPFRATVTFQPGHVTEGFRYLVEQAQIHTITSVLIMNALFMAAALLALRRWDLPFGAHVVLFGVVAVGMAGLDSFERLPLALTAIVGGLAADVTRTWLAPSPSNVRGLRTFAVVVPAAMWLTYFIVFKAAYALPWQIHLWLGTAFFAAVTGLGMSVLVAPPEVPASA
ncbi:MAG TPA: hypothetical protein VFA83_05840 [Acidimicrobiales bacterium]|nr:hypothetical protein [Acidimicrobiales bacterium]